MSSEVGSPRASAPGASQTRSQERAKPTPGPPGLLLCARTDLCRSPPMRRSGPPSPCGSGGPVRRRPMDRAGPSTPKTGDYVNRDAVRHFQVPDPELCSGASAGGGRRLPLTSACLRSKGTRFMGHRASSPLPHRSPGFYASHNSGSISKGMQKVSVPRLGRGIGNQEEPRARQPRRAAMEDGRGAPRLTPSRSKARCLAHRYDFLASRSTSGCRPRLPALFA